jgi:hypothetical protein
MDGVHSRLVVANWTIRPRFPSELQNIELNEVSIFGERHRVIFPF